MAKVYPAFLNERHYLDALQRTLLPSQFALDQLPFSQFLTVLRLECTPTKHRIFNPSHSGWPFANSSPIGYVPTRFDELMISVTTQTSRCSSHAVTCSRYLQRGKTDSTIGQVQCHYRVDFQRVDGEYIREGEEDGGDESGSRAGDFDAG